MRSSAGASVSAYGYDDAGNLRTVSRTAAPLVTFDYDNRDRVRSVTTGASVTRYGYDDDGARTTMISPRNHTTTYLIDGFGRNIGSIDPTSVKTREVLDPAGRSIETRVTLLSGLTETLYRWATREFDAMGRVKKEIPKLFANPITLNPDGTIPTAGITDLVTETTYDGNGNVLTVKDPLNRTTTNAYDGRGRLQRVTDAAGNIIEYTYDDSNNKTQETVTELPPSGAPQVFVTKYQYDGQNRVTKVTDPLNHDTLHEYDPRGNRTKVTDVELHVATAEYDLLGRKTKETDANGGVTTYEYDLLGRLTALVDANTNRTEFTYDADGRLKQEKRPDLRLWVYGYDAEGNRTTVTDPNGTVITTTFDPVSRPTQRDVARGAGVLGPTRVTFGLDPLGRITSSSTTGDTANAVESFAYDSLDRLLNEQEQVGSGPNRTVAKAYDAAGNLTGLTYPSGTALTYDIDALNRIAAVKQAGTPIVSYRDVGARLLDRTLANGIVQTWSYDPGRRLNDILSTKGATTVSDISYTLSNLGNKQTITRPDLAKKGTYLFNANSWVTQEALGVPMAGGTPERQTDYAPDKVLNYTQIEERQNGTLIATKTQTVNSRNQYSAFAGATLTYDPNGNLTGGAGLSGTILAYDFENRLKKATLASGTVVENIYDAQGRKVRESTTISGTATATDYVLHGDQVLEQYKGSNFSARYVHGRGIDETVRAELDVDGDGTLETTVFPVQDELGNVERLSDSAGATLERYDYQGYGKPRIFDAVSAPRGTSSYGWRWLFQGREYLSMLSAYDFRARTLWPELGRFGQEDPRADPNNVLLPALVGRWSGLTDPSGLVVVLVHGILSDGPWAGEMSRALQDSWRTSGHLAQDVIRYVGRTRAGKEFGKGNALNAARGILDADTRHEGQRLASLLNRLQNLMRDSRYHKDEPISLIAHSHGTALLMAALPQLQLRFKALVFAGSDLNPYFNISEAFQKSEHVYAISSPGDLTTGAVAAAGAFGFYSSAANFTQERVPDVQHFRTDSEAQRGVLAWMTAEMSRRFYARYTALDRGLSPGSDLRGEGWAWYQLYKGLLSEFSYGQPQP